MTWGGLNLRFSFQKKAFKKKKNLRLTREKKKQRSYNF